VNLVCQFCSIHKQYLFLNPNGSYLDQNLALTEDNILPLPSLSEASVIVFKAVFGAVT